GPVGRLLGVLGAKHLEHLVQTFLADDVADTHKIAVLCGYLDGEIALGYLEFEVDLLLALDGARLHFFNQCGPVMWVHDRLADLERHLQLAPFAELEDNTRGADHVMTALIFVLVSVLTSDFARPAGPWPRSPAGRSGGAPARARAGR